MRRFVLSTHAYQKVAGDAALATRVLDAAEYPSVSYGVSDKRNIGHNRQERHIRDGIVAVVDAIDGKVITFYADVVETDLRDDQTDAAALDYESQREARKRMAERATRDQKRNARRDRDRAFTFAQKGKKQ